MKRSDEVEFAGLFYVLANNNNSVSSLSLQIVVTLYRFLQSFNL